MDGLKQRILGAFVLISLAVIFIPMLFDEPHEETQAMLIPIPERQPLPSVHIEEPKPVAGLDTLPVPDVDASSAEVVRQDVEQSEKLTVDTAPVAATPAKDKQPQATPQPQSVANQAPAAATTPAKVDPEPATGGWTLQVGTFKSRDNATGLRDRLQAQGLQAYISEVGAGDGRLTRVLVGPLASREESQNLKDRIIAQKLVNDALILSPTP